VSVSGWHPIEAYAAVGDGRTLALIARDGAVDWLCLPDLDSPSVFAAILDPERGGRFELAPTQPYRATRRYLPDTNVLETTYETAGGVARVTDAFTLPTSGLSPLRELVRRVEGVAGAVPFRWRVEPRFPYGQSHMRTGRRAGIPIFEAGAHAVSVRSFAAGEPVLSDHAAASDFEVRSGSSSLLALTSAGDEPIVLPGRDEAERRLEQTVAYWRAWARDRTYEGPWRDAVIRSLLALKLLVYAPSGAIAAAGTTSLPERLGGSANWDYRFSWLRDSVFAVDAFLATGCAREARSFFWWLMHASQADRPHARVLYRLDGGREAPEAEIDLAGYEESRPVRIGNGAAGQLQLDVFGELMQTAYVYAGAGNELGRDTGKRLAKIADVVCRLWRERDSGIWELRDRLEHHTQGKMACAVALERACELAERGLLPGGRVERWRAEASEIRRFVEERCWSERRRSYTAFAGGDELDASVLLASISGYAGGDDHRMRHTIAALREELGSGPHLHRASWSVGREGTFVACSFWLVDALARTGRIEDAAALMDELVASSNDVGLLAEEIDAATGRQLGNVPQALSHLALVNAAVTIGRVE
jgi:GH15 family glucan-1,4-alpha-glucosidase